MSNCSNYVLSDTILAETQTEEENFTKKLDNGSIPGTDSDPTVAEVLQVLFDIGTGEYEVFRVLNEREASSARDIAKELNRDPSSVNRSLKKLFEKNLITRRRRILQSGGHVYNYSTRPPEEIERLLLAGLREWTDTAHNRIHSLVSQAVHFK